VLRGQETENSFAVYWSTSYFPALDGLRAICVALVICFHMHEKVPGFIHGSTGVDIFFVLSGFLITTLLLREKEKYGSVSLKGFYVRRAFRILPIYYIVLLMYFPAIWLLRDATRWHQLMCALPYLLTFTQEFLPKSAGSIFAHSWSLGYEEKFYLLWPLLVLMLHPFRRRNIMILLAIGALILFLPWMAARSYGGLFVGSALGIVLDRSCRNRLQPYLLRIPSWVALGLVVAAYFLLFEQNLPIQFFSAAVALLVAALVLRQSMVRRFLEHPLLVLPGKRSYAMYLVHVLVLNIMAVAAAKARVDFWFVVMPATYVGSFLVATVLFHLVEKPSVEFGRGLSRKLRKRLTESLPRAAPLGAVRIRPIENPVDL
jgi:peptidoglycan/LPS O-acetylase OafA/YrhL